MAHRIAALLPLEPRLDENYLSGERGERIVCVVATVVGGYKVGSHLTVLVNAYMLTAIAGVTPFQGFLLVPSLTQGGYPGLYCGTPLGFFSDEPTKPDDKKSAFSGLY